MYRRSGFTRPLLIGAILLTSLSVAQAQVHPVAPALNSNVGARYTLYLNFSGFNYSGTWGSTGKTPGVITPYTRDADASSFSTTDTTAIRDAWARVAQKYVGFNINVTTVDPAGVGRTDAQRQTYYDQTRYLMHTIIGGTNGWYGSAGGVSYVGTTQNANVSSGRHTNWSFGNNGSPQAGISGSAKTVAEAAAHEQGHGLRLNHQKNEVTGADYSNNNGASGNGSFAPTMGTGYSSQRSTWRVGDPTKNGNDVALLQGNANIGALQDDGVGHSFDTATSLAVRPSGTVDVTSRASKGWIMPKASTSYRADGEDSYTKDYFKFRATGGTVTLRATDGSSFLQSGVADAGATLRSVLRIIDKNGNIVGTGREDSSTLFRTFTGALSAGDYYAQIVSYGGYKSAYEPNSTYFTMGAYFLTGSGMAQPVPEPTSMLALAAGVGIFLRRRRKSA